MSNHTDNCHYISLNSMYPFAKGSSWPHPLKKDIVPSASPPMSKKKKQIAFLEIVCITFLQNKYIVWYTLICSPIMATVKSKKKKRNHASWNGINHFPHASSDPCKRYSNITFSETNPPHKYMFLTISAGSWDVMNNWLSKSSRYSPFDCFWKVQHRDWTNWEYCLAGKQYQQWNMEESGLENNNL